jgi:hypothetical protein
MINVVPFIKTNCRENYKKFLNQPFSVDVLYPVFNENSVQTLFEGWKGKDMFNWYRFTNDNKIILEFYPDYYRIQKISGNTIYQLSFPLTLNEFVNDMYRFGIQLFWTDNILSNLEPKDILDQENIDTYYTNLLTAMGKSHEITWKTIK